jgi:hypothetical protein
MSKWVDAHLRQSDYLHWYCEFANSVCITSLSLVKTAFQSFKWNLDGTHIHMQINEMLRTLVSDSTAYLNSERLWDQSTYLYSEHIQNSTSIQAWVLKAINILYCINFQCISERKMHYQLLLTLYQQSLFKHSCSGKEKWLNTWTPSKEHLTHVSSTLTVWELCLCRSHSYGTYWIQEK